MFAGDSWKRSPLVEGYPRQMTQATPAHPYAEHFPMMDTTSAEWSGLIDSIRSGGLIHPILRFKGKILDGRNRERACLEVGAKPRYEEFSGTDIQALARAWAENAARRHLNPGQMAYAFLQNDNAMGELKRLADEALAEGNAKGGKSNSAESIEKSKSLPTLVKTSPVHVAAKVAEVTGTSRGTVIAAQAYKKAVDHDNVSPKVAAAFAGGRLPIDARVSQLTVTVRTDTDILRTDFIPWKSIQEIAEWVRGDGTDAQRLALADGILEGRR